MSQIKNLQPEFESTFFSEPKTRRNVLKGIASGMTVATLSGCINIRKPSRKIKTYNNEPANLIPGIPNYYATSFELNGDVNGLIATSHEGRPTKIDGNPRHPNNLGKSNAFLQAEIHQLYDPDRFKNHVINQQSASLKNVDALLKSLKKDKSLAIILPNTLSLINNHLLAVIKRKYPATNIYFIDPVNYDKKTATIKDATGTNGYTDYHFSKTKLIVSFNHDFLGSEASRINDISKYLNSQNNFNHVSFSNSLNITNSKSNAIIKSTISEQEHTIIYIAKELSKKYGSSFYTDSLDLLEYNKNHINLNKANKIISELVKNRSQSIVSAGEIHSKTIHNVILLINSILKNINKTITMHPFSSKKTSFLTKKTYNDSIQDLENKITNGRIKNLVSLGIDITRFLNISTDLIQNINHVYLTEYENNYTQIAKNIISKTHFLEDWGVLVSKEGHISIQQPLISPLYKGKSTTDVLLLLADESQTAYSFIQNYLKEKNISFNALKKYGVIEKERAKENFLLISLPLITNLRLKIII